MINESERDAFFEDQLAESPATPEDRLYSTLRVAVSQVFAIDRESASPVTTNPFMLFQRVTASYSGHLLIDSEQAYDQLDQKFRALDHTPVFSIVNGEQTITAVKGRISTQPRQIWLNVALFVATVFSLMYVGTINEIGYINDIRQLPIGLPYAVGLMAILGVHEFGHYFAARFHKVAVSLPYFTPLPLAGTFGTLGAFVPLREPMRNRKILFDFGAAGPLAGLIVAIPILLYGLKTSPFLPIPELSLFTLRAHAVTYGLEGNSILYALAKIVTFGHFVPDGMRDVFINQWASAGWTGLLLTGLNLIPLGQLDGGHILYSLVGDRARRLFYPLVAALVILSVIYPGWAFLAVLLIVFGRLYAVPLDTITPLNPGRRVLAVLCLIIFVLVFVPIPLQAIIVGG